MVKNERIVILNFVFFPGLRKMNDLFNKVCISGQNNEASRMDRNTDAYIEFVEEVRVVKILYVWLRRVITSFFKIN